MSKNEFPVALESHNVFPVSPEPRKEKSVNREAAEQTAKYIVIGSVGLAVLVGFFFLLAVIGPIGWISLVVLATVAIIFGAVREGIEWERDREEADARYAKTMADIDARVKARINTK